MTEKTEQFMFHLLFIKYGKTIFYSFLLLADILLLGIDLKFAAVAVAGSLSGAVVFAFFEKFQGYFQFFIKVLVSTIAGLFSGAFANKYWQILDIEYTGFVFFICGLLSLIVFKALVAFSRGNASKIISEAVKRALNIK